MLYRKCLQKRMRPSPDACDHSMASPRLHCEVSSRDWKRWAFILIPTPIPGLVLKNPNSVQWASWIWSILKPPSSLLAFSWSINLSLLQTLIFGTLVLWSVELRNWSLVLRSWLCFRYGKISLKFSWCGNVMCLRMNAPRADLEKRIWVQVAYWKWPEEA